MDSTLYLFYFNVMFEKNWYIEMIPINLFLSFERCSYSDTILLIFHVGMYVYDSFLYQSVYKHKVYVDRLLFFQPRIVLPGNDRINFGLVYIYF
jgi:hypothetical protein